MSNKKGFTLQNFSRKNLGGFTLIELLVVIAIIGILSSIVLVSLGGARDKAKDARIQADLSQIRAIAELINSDYNGYANLCSGGTLNEGAAVPYGAQLGAIESDIAAQQGTLAVSCYTSSTVAYCASADLISAGQGSFCVDSTGIALTTSTVYNTVCSTTKVTCK